MGIEPTHGLYTRALVLKTRRPTRRLGTSILNNLLNVCIFVNLPVSVGFHKYCQYIRNRALVTKEKFI